MMCVESQMFRETSLVVQNQVALWAVYRPSVKLIDVIAATFSYHWLIHKKYRQRTAW
jgi:hypothetical protein